MKIVEFVYLIPFPCCASFSSLVLIYTLLLKKFLFDAKNVNKKRKTYFKSLNWNFT